MATVAPAMHNGYQSFSNAASSTSSATTVQTQQQQQSSNDEQYIITFFCRALYDYQTQDASSLSFYKNDIIEVLTRLESGWWDGLLGEERGWFPSNYVQVISDDEAEAALSGSENPQQQDNPRDSIVDMSHAMGRDSNMSDSEPEWLDSGDDQPTSRNGVGGHTQTSGNGGRTASDFWVPQVTGDGQIYYLNTQTGQHSRDLPTESDHEISDDDVAGLTSQTSSRAGTSEGLGYSSMSSFQADESRDTAGFGVPQRSSTPEPWVKRLADDGMSYYYWNKVTNEVRWTLPEAALHSSNGRGPSASSSYSSTPSRDRLRSDSEASHYRPRDDPDADHISMYSDDSGVQPFGKGPSTPVYRPNGSSSRTHDNRQVGLTSAEKMARTLQQRLAPPPPELVTDLATTAREAIATVVQSIQLNGSQGRPQHDLLMDDQVRAVVLAVRNLLYVSAPPSGHIPTNVIPMSARDYQTNSASQTLLKPAQRKVTATLSKLVLSARAMQYDSGPSTSETPNRIEGDAQELERAVVAFVTEVQRSQTQAVMQEMSGKYGLKRLRGVFSTANVGLGLVGAGAAGNWKGFGWVAMGEDDEAPGKVLGSEVLNELRSYRSMVEENFAALSASLSSSEQHSVDQVIARCRDIVTRLSAFLTFVADIHVARHVDIDGIGHEASTPRADDVYMQSVSRARLLVRTLEMATQSLYDDGAAVLLTAQAIRRVGLGLSPHDVYASYDYLGALGASLKSNAGVVQQTLEALLAVGYDQADAAQGDYNGSIEWRMSRMSVIEGNLDAFDLRLPPTDEDDGDQDDLIDMELAFQKPSATKALPPVDPSERSAMYGHRSQPSTNSLHMSETSDGTDFDREKMSSTVAPGSPDTVAMSLYDDEAPSSNKAPRADKLRKLLGDEAPQHYINAVNADQKPWYLRPNYSQTEILIDPDGAVRGGTVQALVERLTAHEHGDPTFIKTFLMTYKSFTNLDELFNLLVQRFWIKPPENLNPQQRDEWGKLKQHVIQMRVLNTFKSMVVDEDVLEKDDMYILDHMKQFISNDEVVRFAAAKQLLILIERAQKGGDSKIKTMINTSHQVPPQPIMPKNLKKLKVLDIDPLEMARQLTIMESQLYQKIRPMECLQRSREQKAGESNDNIAHIIQTSNRIANWVADSVLSKEDSRRRATIVKQFISVADRCRGMHNYSSMVAIVSGLNSTPIRRLKRTWEQVNSRFMAQLSACEVTIDTNKNFTNYRSTLAKVSPPCVPFIGVFLTTLTFIQDGSKDNLPGNLVNFRKRQKASEVIQDIKRWQSVPYNFHPIPSVLVYIEESLTQFVDQTTIADQLWNLSLEREPREREDEKMARLLQESGFL